MQRNATAARDADAYRPELIADDEPRYLRRQKPVEIRRKKFSGRGWPFYRRGGAPPVLRVVGVACGGGRDAVPLLLFPPPVVALDASAAFRARPLQPAPAPA